MEAASLEWVSLHAKLRWKYVEACASRPLSGYALAVLLGSGIQSIKVVGEGFPIQKLLTFEFGKNTCSNTHLRISISLVGE